MVMRAEPGKTSTMMPKLSYSLVTSQRDFATLEARWTALLQSCPQHTIFQTWEW